MNIINEIKSPEALLDYMDKNIKYGFIGKNGKHYTDTTLEEWNDWYLQCIVQTGKEVLKSNIGTCWDQVELERLWFEKHNYCLHTFFMWFEVGRASNLPTHTFLIFENNDKYYWFEHAFEPYKGIHVFNSLYEAVEAARSKQIEYTKMNYNDVSDKDMQFLTVYNYSKPKEQLNVDAYLKHVTLKQYN